MGGGGSYKFLVAVEDIQVYKRRFIVGRIVGEEGSRLQSDSASFIVGLVNVG